MNDSKSNSATSASQENTPTNSGHAPSAPEQEKRIIGNILLEIGVSEDGPKLVSQLHSGLFTEHLGAFQALQSLVSNGRSFTAPSFIEALMRESSIDRLTASSNYTQYVDQQNAGGGEGEFLEALELLEQANDKRESYYQGQRLISESLSTTSTALKRALSWPDMDPGQFPINALPEFASVAAQALADTYSLPIELAGMTALALLASACGKGWQLSNAVHSYRNYANIFVLAGAERGVGKGSLKELFDPIAKASANMEEYWRKENLPTLQAKHGMLKQRCDTAKKAASNEPDGEQTDALALVVKLHKEVAELDLKLAAVPGLWCGDSTAQKLGVLLAGNKSESLLIYSPEAGGIIRVWLGRYAASGQPDIDLLLSGYSCEPFKVDRIARPAISLQAPCLSTLLMVQPYLVRELFANKEASERGLLARTMAFIAPGDLMEDDGSSAKPDQHVMDEWDGRVSCLLHLQQQRSEPLQVVATQEASEVLRQFHNESVRLALGPLSSIKGDLSRWRENACRVALAIHAAEWPDDTNLNAQTAERAVAIVRWAGLSTVRLLATGLEQSAKARAGKLRHWLLGAGGKMTVGALSKRHGMDEAEAVSMVKTFPTEFVLVERSNLIGGRPTQSIELCAIRN